MSVMITPSQWRYLFYNEDLSQYVYLDSAGNLQYSATPFDLSNTPDGWQKKSIGWERDAKTFGLARLFVLPLGYVESPAVILRKIALKLSFESNITLIIQQRALDTTVTPNVWIWEDFYRGEVDLSKILSEELKVSAPNIEGGIAKDLKANINTVYEFPLDFVGTVQHMKTVKMDGVKLFQTSNFIIPEVQGFQSNVPISFVNKEGTAPYIAAVSQQVGQPNQFFLRNVGPVPISVHLVGQIKFKVNSHTTFVHAQLIKVNGATQTVLQLNDFTSGLNDSTVYTIDYDRTVVLNTDDQLWLRLIASGVQPQEVLYQESSFKASYSSTYRTSYIRAISAWELFKCLCEKALGSNALAESTLLEHVLSDILITCGDAVRGLDNPVLKTSLVQFIEFCRAQAVAGYGIEAGKLRIEEAGHFLSVATPMALGVCRKFKWSFAEAFLFNAVKIGYNAKDTDDVNGKYSFNNSHLYSTSIKKVAKTFEIICPYAADPYYIELTRINLEGKTTTDNSADNDLMILNTVDDSLVKNYLGTNMGPVQFVPGGAFFYFFNLPGAGGDLSLYPVGSLITISGTATNNKSYRVTQVSTAGVGGVDLDIFVAAPVGSELAVDISITINRAILNRVAYINADTGVPDIASLFNIEYLTPKRMFRRWQKYFNSCLWQFIGSDFVFETTEKNRDLRTDDGTEIVDEDSTEHVGMARYFKSIELTFETLVPAIVPVNLAADPNGGFTTETQIATYTGILMKAGMMPNTEEAQGFKFLAGPDLDENILVLEGN